jgi:hypothetical protein
MPDRAAVLASNLDVGGCHSVKQGLSAAWHALVPPLSDNADDPNTPEPADGNLGFRRTDARLAVLVWSDDDDQSPGAAGGWYDQLALAVPGTRPDFAAVVAPAAGCPGMSNPGARYLGAVRSLGGFAASVCDADWSAAAEALVDEALRPRVRFPLRAAADPASVRVSVDGVAATGWSYDAAAPAVVFAAAPRPGAQIGITYSEPCPGP